MSASATVQDRGAQPELRELEQFLYQEARLLDEQRWSEWSDLFTSDGEYWVPASHDQADPQNHISLMYETGLLRAVRIKRFKHPNAFSLQPKPRSIHFVSNMMLDEYDRNSCVVTSRFIMLQYRREELDTFAGVYTHHLERAGDDYKIRKKRVDLINCDAPLGNILLYL